MAGARGWCSQVGVAHDQAGKAHYSGTDYTEKVRAGRASMRRRVAQAQRAPWLERVESCRQVSGALAEAGKAHHSDTDDSDKVRAGRAMTR